MNILEILVTTVITFVITLILTKIFDVYPAINQEKKELKVLTNNLMNELRRNIERGVGSQNVPFELNAAIKYVEALGTKDDKNLLEDLNTIISKARQCNGGRIHKIKPNHVKGFMEEFKKKLLEI
ncbi:hypothetical protein KBC04_02420 [Candidatus Babeliales bacterium]|nr:hypothetical protein [Candidatus Babeliales bacterium]MBP9843735.1 hypothetical protein [Candidatus Babeliales bacterium]